MGNFDSIEELKKELELFKERIKASSKLCDLLSDITARFDESEKKTADNFERQLNEFKTAGEKISEETQTTVNKIILLLDKSLKSSEDKLKSLDKLKDLEEQITLLDSQTKKTTSYIYIILALCGISAIASIISIIIR